MLLIGIICPTPQQSPFLDHTAIRKMAIADCATRLVPKLHSATQLDTIL